MPTECHITHYWIHRPDNFGNYISHGPCTRDQAITHLIGQFHPKGLTYSITRAALIIDLFTQHQLDYLPLELNQGEHRWITSAPSHQSSPASSAHDHSNNAPEQQTSAHGAPATSKATPTPAHTANSSYDLQHQPMSTL